MPNTYRDKIDFGILTSKPKLLLVVTLSLVVIACNEPTSDDSKQVEGPSNARTSKDADERSNRGKNDGFVESSAEDSPEVDEANEDYQPEDSRTAANGDVTEEELLILGEKIFERDCVRCHVSLTNIKNVETVTTKDVTESFTRDPMKPFARTIARSDHEAIAAYMQTLVRLDLTADEYYQAAE